MAPGEAVARLLTQVGVSGTTTALVGAHDRAAGEDELRSRDVTSTGGEELERILRERGWTVALGGFELWKGTWRLVYDTSSWLLLETEHNPRTSDVAVPDAYRAGWTMNLIEHLARMEDERYRLRAALAAIRDDPAGGPSALSAAAALAECYHTWLVERPVDAADPAERWLNCPICGSWKRQPSAPNSAE